MPMPPARSRGLAPLRPTSWLVAALCFAGAARGQPGNRGVDSIEWLVADSAAVVRGAVVEMKVEAAAQEGVLVYEVTLRVDETLKGRHQASLRFMFVSGNHELDEILRWKDQGRPLLVFLEESRCLVASRRNRELARFPLTLRTGYRQDSVLELLPAGGEPAYDLSLKPLERPEEVLRAARAAARAPAMPGKVCGTWFDLNMLGLDVRLTVPVDGRLEAKAREWTRSADKDLRHLGAMALVYFRSEANATLLRGLLDDPGVSEVMSQERNGVERRDRVHPVREEAYLVLRAWGHDVPRPAFRERLP